MGADFSGSPYSFVDVERTFAFEGSWTFDAWVFRDQIIFTQNGKLLGLVAPDDVGARARDAGTIRIYETGSTGRGVVVQYTADQLRYAQYSTPVGQWFHLVVSVDAQNNNC